MIQASYAIVPDFFNSLLEPRRLEPFVCYSVR